mmetsp:Transcript_18288/g.47817  ORF Transcript_18288/g.47817 Transcript_18288/m.47817 type:complete len:245 (-) Transcript_18288:651-1385(-)
MVPLALDSCVSRAKAAVDHCEREPQLRSHDGGRTIVAVHDHTAEHRVATDRAHRHGGRAVGIVAVVDRRSAHTAHRGLKGAQRRVGPQHVVTLVHQRHIHEDPVDHAVKSPGPPLHSEVPAQPLVGRPLADNGGHCKALLALGRGVGSPGALGGRWRSEPGVGSLLHRLDLRGCPRGLGNQYLAVLCETSDFRVLLPARHAVGRSPLDAESVPVKAKEWVNVVGVRGSGNHSPRVPRSPPKHPV